MSEGRSRAGLVGLALLEARRVALSLGALAAPVLALLLTRSEPTGDSPALAFDAARAGWLGAGVVVAWTTASRAARFGRDWRQRDGAWLGALPVHRGSLAAAALIGITLGSLVPCALAATVIAWRTPAPANAVELAMRSGPGRSLRLDAGGFVEHAFDEPQKIVAGSRARVRAVPAVGGESPTSRIRVASGAHEVESLVARYTWIDVELEERAPGIAIANVGEGTVALVGPAPFEVWRPSPAVFGGHARVGLGLALFACVLASAAFAAGAWLGPVLAGGTALALVVAPTLAGGAPPWAPLPGPTGPLARGLAAVAEGRIPSAPAPAAYACALLALALGAALAAPPLRRLPERTAP